jgi:type II secretory pathway component GspD/PulD (secretin)
MLRTLLLSAALGLLSLNAFAADEPPKTDAKPPEQASYEVYRLKNADLNDTVQAFNALTGQASTVVTDPRGPGPRTTTRPPRGNGPGSSGFGPASFPSTPPTGIVCRALADPRTRSVIVRGTEKDQQLAADLVAILDTPEGKPLPALKTVKAFRLQHLDAGDLVSMLQLLDPNMSYRVAPVGAMKLLLATGTDEQMKELADAVKKLDIPGVMK